MKEDESVFQRLQKEHQSVDKNTWERKVITRDISEGLKEAVWNMNGIQKQFVGLLSQVVSSMGTEHMRVTIYSHFNRNQYEVHMEPAKDEVAKNSLPGEEKYADRNIIKTMITKNSSFIGVFSDSVTAGEHGDSTLEELFGMLTELRKNDRVMKETTDAVMRVLLEMLGNRSDETVARPSNPLEDYIGTLNLDI